MWKNGLLVPVKSRIQHMIKKLSSFNNKIETVKDSNGYLKDVMDLNTELMGYFSALNDNDNVNVRDLFDFLTICFYEYEDFFSKHQREIFSNDEEKNVLLPVAHDIVYTDMKSMLEFINNNTINYPV